MTRLRQSHSSTSSSARLLALLWSALLVAGCASQAATPQVTASHAVGAASQPQPEPAPAVEQVADETAIAPVIPQPSGARASRAVVPAAAPVPRPAAIQPIGQIQIPRIGLVHDIYQGLEMRYIDRGPSHWPGTALPGQESNSVFAGHRVTNTRPFYDIDKLQRGDEIIYRMRYGTVTYRVTETFVVQPDAMWIADPTPENITTIFACHPKGSARQRYVARAALVGEPVKVSQGQGGHQHQQPDGGQGPAPTPKPTPAPTPRPTPAPTSRPLINL